jgi:hypothetical protein
LLITFYLLRISIFTLSPLWLSILLVGYAFVGGTIMAIQEISWIFYSLILIFLGGIIVVFVYACSLRQKSKSVSGINWEATILFLIFAFVLKAVPEELKAGFRSQSPRLVFGPASVGGIGVIAVYLITVLLAIIKITAIREGPIKIYANLS